MEGNREIYLAAGMNDFVSKPIKTAELQEAIARQCGVAVEYSGQDRHQSPLIALLGHASSCAR